jgi:spermidine synthase
MNKVSKLLFVTLITLLLPPLVNAKVIHSERSLYKNILVDDIAGKRCLKFSVKRKKSSQSCINKAKPQELVFDYYKLVMSSLLLVEQPQSILIIGLGGGILSNTFHHLFPEARIDNVEIDPAVITVAKNYFNFTENKQVHAVAKDGRIFIKRAALKKRQYDLVILDAFNGDYIPEHLMTREFLIEVRSILSPNGVMAANTFSSSGLYAYESATYHNVFGDFYNVRYGSYGNRVILSQPKQKVTRQKLKQKALSMYEVLLPFDVNILEILNVMSIDNDWPENSRLLTDQYSPANLLQ